MHLIESWNIRIDVCNFLQNYVIAFQRFHRVVQVFEKNSKVVKMATIYIRMIKFLRNFEFRNWQAMRGGLMLPDSISEEELEID